MKRSLIITAALFTSMAIIVIQCSRRPSGQSDISFYLPGPENLEEWKSIAHPQKFTGKDLYSHMNGGAEKYLSLGFKQLITQDYSNNNNKTITLEIFEMENTTGALEMYASKTDNDGIPLAIGNEALLEDYYLNFRKNNFLVTLTGFDSEQETINGLMTIAKIVDERI